MTRVSGILKVHPRGFGFLQPEDSKTYQEDIFIPRHQTGWAVDGDLVEVEVHPVVSEKGPEGRVVAILERGRTHVGGTILRRDKRGKLMAHAPLLGEDMITLKPCPDLNPAIGDRVIIHVLEWGSSRREPKGEVAKVLGSISDPSVDTLAAIEEYELFDAFPDQVIEEAQSFGKKVTAKDLKEREDLRDLVCVTIDPTTARDFDDALSLTQDKKGNYQVGVHIADVSHYVRPGSALDKEARKRCNSVYFPGNVLPMLPHELSSHLCSLKPEVDRLAVSVLMTLDPEGRLQEYRITRSVIHSKKRFTYEGAKEVLDGKQKSPHADLLSMMVDVCHRLKERRGERGSIEFALPDVQLQIDEEGVPLGVEIVEYDITHQMVEEFMLLANQAVAKHLSEAGKPLTYRVHEEPALDNMRDFALLARAFGFKISKDPTSEELQELFDQARGSPYGKLLAMAFIRNMKLAVYATNNIGHYGLGLEHYTHFTSPIRRYIDLVVHRALFDESDPQLEKVATECSERERLSARAEQSVILLKKLRLLEKKKQRVFDAVITGVKPAGLIFEIEDLLLDGFIPISEICRDYLVYVEERHILRGENTGVVYQPGKSLRVRLKEIDLISQKTSWSVAHGKKGR